MKKLIIPWPVGQCRDFNILLEFLESIGFSSSDFIIRYIVRSSHPSNKMQYTDIENWILMELDRQYLKLAQLIERPNYTHSEAFLEEHQIYFDRMDAMVKGDDIHYEDVVFSMVGVLLQVYSHIYLPDLTRIRTRFSNDLGNGFALIEVDDYNGDLIHVFYQPEIHGHITLPH